jgi:hypothetical protein
MATVPFTKERRIMERHFRFAVMIFSLLVTSSTSGQQIVSGVMTVTGAEMH